MTVTIDNIGWGTYQNYAGPWYKGSVGLPEVTKSSSDNSKMLAVVTATEGGRADAINMYDSCVVSVGYIQLCGSIFLVNKFLSYAFKALGEDHESFTPLIEHLGSINASCTNDTSGFNFINSNGSKVDTLAEVQEFFLGCNGRANSWDDSSKAYAKKWAVTLASVLASPIVRDLQIDYVGRRLLTFCMPTPLKEFISNPNLNTPMQRAAKAAYVSFSANNPKKAEESYAKTNALVTTKFSDAWVTALLKTMTFGPGIGIYPHRYNAIRPVLERLYGVDLPDFAKDLSDAVIKFDASVPVTGFDLTSVTGVQKALIYLGYDLGPSGADGVYGPKTTMALIQLCDDRKIKDRCSVDPYELLKNDVMVALSDAVNEKNKT